MGSQHRYRAQAHTHTHQSYMPGDLNTTVYLHAQLHRAMVIIQLDHLIQQLSVSLTKHGREIRLLAEVLYVQLCYDRCQCPHSLRQYWIFFFFLVNLLRYTPKTFAKQISQQHVAYRAIKTWTTLQQEAVFISSKQLTELLLCLLFMLCRCSHVDLISLAELRLEETIPSFQAKVLSWGIFFHFS